MEFDVATLNETYEYYKEKASYCHNIGFSRLASDFEKILPIIEAFKTSISDLENVETKEDNDESSME